MKQRIITGVIAGGFFIALTIIGGWFFYGLLLLLAIIGYGEFVRMNGLSWTNPASLLGFAGVLAFMLPWQEWSIDEPSGQFIAWLLMFGLLSITVFTKNQVKLDEAALLLLGAMYVGIGFQAMHEVRSANGHGLLATIVAFCAIWSSDIGAYFFGKAFGKHKLWPAISPNKTIEGSIGGVLLSLAVALLFAVIYPDMIGFADAFWIGILAAVAGQLGDLIQSAYKRVRGIKDSGALLPGHGGVLDRCDSWIIVFPLLLMTGLLPF
ncbi:phosphatidate cytidylyltransferase [Paenibacillus methanolicus]|uniref:Phosphatidate cytidylyltransferase n=1 Tax=Paenibacillus methanolicus TaxID=582686 RepID=A0A5S5CEQ7_9BACL|nr:phosphatidate cytidylyltransferase [Paenibacillus methanolicus]TYP77619.1 phosphatidate cytidylyltransferase [Paenibacillus methanolicus]